MQHEPARRGVHGQPLIAEPQILEKARRTGLQLRAGVVNVGSRQLLDADFQQEVRRIGRC